jgi:hypothetical protein
MPVLQVLFILIVVAVAMGFLNSGKIPYITGGWKTLINWVVGILVAWWLIFVVFGVDMNTFGVVHRVR